MRIDPVGHGIDASDYRLREVIPSLELDAVELMRAER
jgi:hypothetical protein